MAAHLTFTYDRAADILHIDTCSPYAEQESEELGDEVVARLNPETGRWRTWRCCSSPHGCYGANWSSCRSQQSYGWESHQGHTGDLAGSRVHRAWQGRYKPVKAQSGSMPCAESEGESVPWKVRTTEPARGKLPGCNQVERGGK